MKYLKMLGLAAVAAMALTAIMGAGSASATVLCKETVSSGCKSDYASGTKFEMTLKAGGTGKMEAGGITLWTCTGGSVLGTTSTTGGAAATVKVAVTAANVTWTNCTYVTDTVTGGELEIHNIAGTADGTVTGIGFAFVQTSTPLGTCTYGFGAGTDLGTLTHGTSTTDATLAIKTTINKVSGHTNGAFCPSSGVWNAEYTVTSPTPLSVSAS